MSQAEDARTLRRRLDGLDRSGAPDDSAGNPTILVKTIAVSSYPTSAQKVFAARRVVPSGTEVEGSAVTLTAVGGALYILNTGTAIPPVGTHMLATLFGGRLCVRYDG